MRFFSIQAQNFIRFYACYQSWCLHTREKRKWTTIHCSFSLSNATAQEHRLHIINVRFDILCMERSVYKTKLNCSLLMLMMMTQYTAVNIVTLAHSRSVAFVFVPHTRILVACDENEWCIYLSIYIPYEYIHKNERARTRYNPNRSMIFNSLCCCFYICVLLKRAKLFSIDRECGMCLCCSVVFLLVWKFALFWFQKRLYITIETLSPATSSSSVSFLFVFVFINIIFVHTVYVVYFVQMICSRIAILHARHWIREIPHYMDEYRICIDSIVVCL